MRNTLTTLSVLLCACVLAAQAQTPAFTSAGVLNAASQAGGTIAPGMLADITGSNLGTPNFFGCSSVLPLPTTCNGVQVLVNGVAAPMVYESAGEVSFQVPFSVSGSATLQVTFATAGTTLKSAIVAVPVAAAAPGLYSSNGTGTGTGYYYDLSQSSLFTEASQPVQAGDTLVLYGTGFGATNPLVAVGIRGPDPIAVALAAVTVTVGTSSATGITAGLEPTDSPAQGTPGTDQVQFTVPSGLAPGTYPMVVTVGGVQSQAVQVVVAAPPLEITSISPASPTVGTNQVVKVNGSGFQSGLTVALYVTGSNTPTIISGSQIQSLTNSSFQMTVTFAAAGNYNITVTDPGGIESRAYSFTVVPPGPVSITKVENAASYAAGIESGSWVSILGTNLAPDTRIWQASDFVGLGSGLPLSLDGVSVTIDGKAAAVYYISPTQINVQAPSDSALGSGVAVAVKNAVGTAGGTTTLLTYAPAFFPLYAPGNPAGASVYAAAIHQTDGTIVVPPGFFGAGTTTRSATPGEYIQIYGTGFGPTNPVAPAGQLISGLPTLLTPFTLQISIGGVSATVFQGTGYLVAPGEYQFNVLVPTLPNGDQPIVATIGGVTTQTGISIPIKN